MPLTDSSLMQNFAIEVLEVLGWTAMRKSNRRRLEQPTAVTAGSAHAAAAALTYAGKGDAVRRFSPYSNDLRKYVRWRTEGTSAGPCSVRCE